ncbi:JAB domain-containing protein [Neobacillus sp. D3-1R]|uniref:JAB domain-containing protein n=1 Tax=Neobacillus sp. D3-1R TaxID=3445778 RepID=UPI003FA058C0
MQQQTQIKVEKKERMRRLNVISLKMVKEGHFCYKTNVVRSPIDVVSLAREYISDSDREIMALVCLNTKNKITGLHTISVGSLNSSIVHPRECFKLAIANNSASIIVFHNHPSNDCTPSREDIEVTKRLKEAGQILGVELLDHLIVGETNHYSMKEHGYV